MEDSIPQASSLPWSLVGQPIGSYRVIEPLGSGGMSTVFRAVHVESGHEVALKVLLGTLARNSTLLQRFLREARSAETLEHPNVVSIYDRGVDQGRHYLVLEYVPGGDFHDYVQRHGPLGAADAIAVIRGIASGLRYAAGRGLIHRDIKPSNLLRPPSGEPKIIDLGLALQSGFEDERVTREGTTVGTVDYMAPEQARDSRATSSLSDIYSLGCTFYYLLAGVPPFPGGDITDKLTRHARTPAPDIRDLRPDIPAGLARILLRMMAKQPEDRFAGYDELIAALDSVSLEESGGANGIALMPLDEDESAEEIQPGPETGGARNGTRSLWDVVDEDGLALESATGMSLDLADEREAPRPRPVASEAAAPLPRLGQSSPPDEPVFLEDEAEPESETVLAVRNARSAPTWILASGGIGAVAILLAIVLLRMFGGPGAAGLTSEDIPEPDAEATDRVAVVRPTPSAVFDTTSRRDRTKRSTASGTTSRPRPEARKPDWVEPEDVAPEPGDATAPSSDLKEARSHLPEWARGPVADGQEGPVWVVRRVADAGEGQTEPTLHYALDQHIGGTVELGDEGPFPVDDLRMSGESRRSAPVAVTDRSSGSCVPGRRMHASRPRSCPSTAKRWSSRGSISSSMRATSPGGSRRFSGARAAT